MTNTSATGTYALAVDWTDGRTPTYERHIGWRCTEADARKWFAREARRQAGGARCALIGPTGRIITEHR